MKLAATVGSPFLIESPGESPNNWLLLGHDGLATVSHPSGTCTLGPNQALLLPGQSWTLLSEHESSLTAIGFNPLRLLAAARAMAPSDWSPPASLSLPLTQALVLPTDQHPAYEALVAAIARVMPAIGRGSQQGEAVYDPFPLEHQLYRLIAALVFPTLPNTPSELSRAGLEMVDRRLDGVLAYISLHLDEALPLTVLEKQSNYSRRSLHYAFQHRFSCTPLQWIREQRMAMALQHLQRPNAGETVRSIATACGYHSMGRFSIDFQRTYGCKPSSVLRGKASSSFH